MDYDEVGLYLSLCKTDEELKQMDLYKVCPKRKSKKGPRNITGCGTKEKKEERHKPWTFPKLAKVNKETKRRMITESLKIVLKTLLRTHTYKFASEIRRQKEGGAIGMELTGVIAQIFMVWWDKELQNRLQKIDFQLRLHERYVDDTNTIAKKSEVGARYDGERIIITDTSIDEDQGIPDDKRTMTLLQSVAAHIHPSIRITIDYPSNYMDGKIPMLDVKMWIADVDGRKMVLYEHYEKEMATKAVMHAMSAIPMQTKRTVLSQEMLRILIHCSKQLPWERICTHVNNFMRKLQYSGYNQLFRCNVAKSALNAYKIIKEKEEQEIRPMNRPKDWMKHERMEEKQRKAKNWYKSNGFDSVVFVPMTPGNKLKHMYENEIKKSGIRIKVIERTGRTLKSQLQTSNPFKGKLCGRQDCFVCTTTGIGNCNTESITYKITCRETNCTKNKVYIGETASSGYTRGLKHKSDLSTKNVSNSPLWRHCLEEHNGEIQTFEMCITGTYKNDAMLRQISEAVQINNTDVSMVMNDRAEWNMTRVPRMSISTG